MSRPEVDLAAPTTVSRGGGAAAAASGGGAGGAAAGGAGARSDLTDVEISEIIQAKTCKVTTEYGKGTGHFINDKEGILLTSFHLVSSYLKSEGPFSIDNSIHRAILFSNGYIDNQSFLTPKAFWLNSAGSIDLSKAIEVTFTLPDGRFSEPIKTYTQQEYLRSNSAAFKVIIFNMFKTCSFVLNGTINIHYDGEILVGKIYYPKDSDRRKLNINYAFYDTLPVEITHFGDGTSFPSTKKILKMGEEFRPLPDPPVRLSIGETVYYAGYPLTLEDYSFGRGMISSILHRGLREFAVIEAPIVPGCSGGPVFVKKDGRLYFIGIISSEIAQISEKIHEMQSILKRTSGSGMGMSVTMADGSELNHGDALSELADTVLSNLSTGRGKAVIIRSLSQLFETHYDLFDELLSQPYEFLVPKPLETKKLRLFQYVGTNTRLYKGELLTYFAAHTDECTRCVIFSGVNHKRLDDENYIQLPNIDVFPTRTTEDIPPNQILSIVTAREDVYKKNIMRYLYTCAYLCSQGRIEGAVFDYAAAKKEIPVHESLMITQKFLEDHVGGETSRDSAAVADEVAERRGISTSTTLPKTAEKTLSGEGDALQDFYQQALSLVSTHARTNKKIIIGLYFLSIKLYQLQIRSASEGSRRVSDKFWYSVIQKDDKYYIHHYQDSGSEVSAGWTKLNVEIPPSATKTEVYYEDCDEAASHKLYRLV